jgi:hypothetical protein
MTPDSASFYDVSSPFRPASSNSERPSSARGENSKTESSTSPGHILRLICRMKAATPKVVADRLREQWQESADSMIQEELELEKTLWAVVASESPLLDAFSKNGRTFQFPNQQQPHVLHNKNILNIDGSIGKQLICNDVAIFANV